MALITEQLIYSLPCCDYSQVHENCTEELKTHYV